MVRLLLKHGADPLLYKQDEEEAPLYQAVAGGDLEVVKVILNDWAGEPLPLSIGVVCGCWYRRKAPGYLPKGTQERVCVSDRWTTRCRLDRVCL